MTILYNCTWLCSISNTTLKQLALLFQAGLTALAVLKYRKGIAEDFSAGDMGQDAGPGSQPAPSPYSAYPSAGGGGGGYAPSSGGGGYPPSNAGGYGGGESGDPYQQAPFTGVPEQKPQQPPADFQPPTY